MEAVDKRGFLYIWRHCFPTYSPRPDVLPSPLFLQAAPWRAKWQTETGGINDRKRKIRKRKRGNEERSFRNEQQEREEAMWFGRRRLPTVRTQCYLVMRGQKFLVVLRRKPVLVGVGVFVCVFVRVSVCVLARFRVCLCVCVGGWSDLSFVYLWRIQMQL